MKHQIYKLLFLLAALMMTGCDCPYLDGKYGESDYEYYRRTGYDRLTADLLPGLWQCYYPMFVGNVEFKEVSVARTLLARLKRQIYVGLSSNRGLY